MEYEPVIGLEVHCRISSKTKMFCRCSNDIFNAEPNTHVCPVCMGFPGMLPLMNEEVVRKGILGALALGCEIPEFSKMDRKSYFYPDLPKGFQISQYDLPVSVKGGITITLADGSSKRIGITRLHLEDDAGKLTHTAGGTLVDYNRSGTPLMEIVSDPDLRSVEEASLYARQLQKIMRYVGASDADMEKGMMRFDINVSLRPKGQKEFGIRSETKNLNSFRSLEKALEYEIKRQTELLESGGAVVQETRGWLDDKEITVSQRGKEEAADYRYFPEPDIPPIVVTRDMVEELKNQIPELPEAKASRYQSEYGLSVVDAGNIASDADLAGFYDELVKVSGTPKRSANWLLSELRTLFFTEDFVKDPDRLGTMIRMIEEGQITNTIAKNEFLNLLQSSKGAEEYFNPFIIVEDLNELRSLCQDVINRNPQIVADFKGGKEKAIGRLVGQVMGATKGAANPKSVNEILRKLLI